MTDATFDNGTRPGRAVRLLLLLVICFSAFIQYNVVSRTIVEEPLRVDASEYLSYAYNLKNFDTYSMEKTWLKASQASAPIPDSIRPPGYPLFLLLVGDPQPTEAFLSRVSMIQGGLGVLSVWLAYLVAAHLTRPIFAVFVALLSAISPHAATISTYLLTESLFQFLLLASVLALLKAFDGRRISMFILAGGLWGLSALVRSTALYFPLLLMVALFAIPKLRPLRKQFAVALLSFVVILSPWVIRNQSPIVEKPGTSLLVKALSHGSYPGFMYQDLPESFGFPYLFDPMADGATRNLPSVLGDIAGRFHSNPGKYVKWYLLGKPYFFLSMENVQGFDVLIYPTTSTPYYEDVRFAILRWFSVEAHWPLMLTGVAGMILLAIRPSWLGLSDSQTLAASLVALLLAYAIAFHMVVAPFPRYAIPFRPFIYALALIPIQAIWLRVVTKRQQGRHAPNSGIL